MCQKRVAIRQKRPTMCQKRVAIRQKRPTMCQKRPAQRQESSANLSRTGMNPVGSE